MRLLQWKGQMLPIPDTIDKLIQLVETDGDTPEQLRKLARLQALTVAKVGEEFVKGAFAEEEKRTEEFRESIEA